MAERRMFAKTIIGSDAFIEMPTSARLLYYDLGMRADDDGFINSPKSLMRMTGASDDDMKLLIAKKFIIPFQSGIVVIKHWNINNYIQKDRYTETKYKDEKALLELDENKAYKLPETTKNIPCIQNGYNMDTQVSLGKVSLDKDINSSCPKNKFSDESLPIILSQKLFTRIKSNNPKAKEPNIQSWAKHIDLMLRIDKRTADEIEAVIDWCQQNNFWYTNILSTDKLRKQYDRLVMEMNKKTKPKSTDSNQHILDEIGDEYFT